MENVTFENVQELLNGGKKIEEVFDYVYYFQDGFARVKLNWKYNFIDKNGKILSPNQWFDYAYDFHEGFANVQLNEKENFIDKNGNLLSNQWFDNVGYFQDGLARVKLNGKWNIIDRNGNMYDENRKPLNENINMKEVNFENVQELLNSGKKPEELFNFVDNFYNGFAYVRLNGKYNYIDKSCKLLSPNRWFDDCWCFQEGFGRVMLNGNYNYINKNGQILSTNPWFDYCDDFKEGFGRVWLNGKCYKIDTNGKLTIDKPSDKKDIEENKENKMLYIVLLNNEYVDTFTNAEEALDCIIEKQSTGQISVVKKLV
jgi:hypothetical protein